MTATIHQQLSEGWQFYQGGVNVQDAEVTVVMYDDLWTGNVAAQSAAYQYGGMGDGQPEVHSISHDVFMPGAHITIHGVGLDKAGEPPLDWRAFLAFLASSRCVRSRSADSFSVSTM